MIFADLAATVSRYAPILGGALGGPIGGVVGSLISSVFGGDSKDPADLVQRIQADPEAALKLKTLEYQHQQELAKVSAQNYLTEADDRKSARDMNVKLHDHMPNVLAIIFIVIYAVIQYHIVNNPGNQDDVISARVQDIFVMIISFYFGSAHRNKQEGKKL